MKEEIVKLIVETARDLESDEIKLADDINSNTQLFGKEGVFDSMGLVTLIVAVEQAIEDQFEASVALADEKALSQARSPYRTVDSLAEYAAAQLAER